MNHLTVDTESDVLEKGMYGSIRFTNDKKYICKCIRIDNEVYDYFKVGASPSMIIEMSASKFLKNKYILSSKKQEIFVKDKVVNQHIYYKKYDTDLYKYGKENAMTLGVIKKIIYQILRGLYYSSKRGILHLDIKSSNILINTKSHDIKICDFGIAKILSKDKTYYDMDEIQTSAYRCPEFFLQDTRRNFSVDSDIWSVGAIFIELFKGSFCFGKSNNYFKTILSSFNISEETYKQLYSFNMNKLDEYKLIFDTIECRFFYNNISYEDCFDLIELMLCLNPQKRISIENALKHKCFNNYNIKTRFTINTFDTLRQTHKNHHRKFRKLSNLQIYNNILRKTWQNNFFFRFKKKNKPLSTLFLAFNYVDYYMQIVGQIDDSKMEIVMMACMNLASKINENECFKINDKMISVENDVIKILDHNLFVVTEYMLLCEKFYKLNIDDETQKKCTTYLFLFYQNGKN